MFYIIFLLLAIFSAPSYYMLTIFSDFNMQQSSLKKTTNKLDNKEEKKLDSQTKMIDSPWNMVAGRRRCVETPTPNAFTIEMQGYRGRKESVILRSGVPA
jgi:hypothetical protein